MARDLSDALKFLAALQGSPSEKAHLLAQQIPVQPFLVNFLPALDNPTLLTLFADNPNLPQGRNPTGNRQLRTAANSVSQPS